MKKIGIIVAMQKEFDSLFEKYGWNGCGFVESKTRGGVPFVAAVSGIGKVNAAVCAFDMWREYGVTDILSLGCAGGMTNDVKVGDVVIGKEYCYHDVWCGEPNQRGQVQGHPMFYPANDRELAWLCPTAKHGLIATGDALCDNELMAGAIVQTLGTNPLAVDMESAAIAQVCYQYNVRFTSVRVISDNPLLGSHAEEYENFWQKKDHTLSNIIDRFMTMDK